MAPAAPLRIIDLHERDVRVFPREELFDQRGRSLVLPDTRALHAIELKDVVAGVELRATGLIGYIPLTADTVLNVRPKFPLSSLWAMLEVSDERYAKMLPVLRSYVRGEVGVPHKLLAHVFCHYLRGLVSRGIARAYHPKFHQGYYTPKINFGRSVSRFLSRGDEVSIAADSFIFSANVPVNGVLKSACMDFLRITIEGEDLRACRELILDALSVLDRVKEVRLQYGDEKLASVAPRTHRDQYLGALAAYSIFLGHTGVGFSYDPKGQEMPSFLFNLDEIFENFIRNSLREGFRDRGISVVDGNKTAHQQSLFRDNKQYPTKPDALIKRGKAVLAIGEAKYKPRIAEADRYQVISHVIANDSPLGIWISPSSLGDGSSLRYIGSISTGARFFHYSIDISEDLNKSRERMVSQLAEVIDC